MSQATDSRGGRGRQSRAAPGRSGRTRLQEEQKQETHKKIIDAAYAAFTENSYAASSVDDIAGRAGVSRTTFYRHFDGKWDVAVAMFAVIMPTVDERWQELADFVEPSERQIAGWLDRMLQLLSDNRALVAIMRQTDASENAFGSLVAATHQGVIEKLALTMPAFARALSGNAAGREAHVLAHLLLLQFDEFVYTIAVREWNVERRLAVKMMARQFHTFIAAAR